VFVIAGVVGCVLPAAGASRYDSALRFQTLLTPHFALHFHQGEESLALRLSLICEDEHARLVPRLGHAPRARTHVVLVDQNDDSNGWTTPLPYNLIELTAAPPGGVELIGNTDDWLRLVFRHEYTHVLHLDLARGWAHAIRDVFGRTPFAFPNLFLPEWQIEGLATFEESLDGQGRMHAGDFRTIVSQAARYNRLEPLDRVNGGLVAWPDGTGWYAYGALFDEYLAHRFGPAALGALSARTAGRLPYLASGAFRDVFGASLGTLWRDFEADLQRRAGVPTRALAPRQLTNTAYLTGAPRFDRDGTVLFTVRDAHRFPSVERLSRDGLRATRLATRVGGDQLAVAAQAIYFDQLEYVRSTGLVSDLYRLDRASGRVRRLTYGARLTQPDVSSDGRWLAAIHTQGGTRSLAVFERSHLDGATRGSLPQPLFRLREAGTVMATPRWSPIEPRIALERRRLNGPSELIVVDVPAGAVHVVATSPRGRNVTPAWTPDGRSLVFASDRDGGPFNLYRATLSADATTTGVTRLTELDGGAHSPDVSADGRSVLFVGYRTNGYDVFMLTLPGSAVAAASPGAVGDPTHVVSSEALSATVGPRTTTMEGRRRTTTISHDAEPLGKQISGVSEPIPQVPGAVPYRPWSSLWPRAWLPIITASNDEVRLGASAAGADALAYHGWAASASWSVARRPELDPVSPGRRPDVTVLYEYSRWRPTLYADASDETTPFLLPSTGTDPAVPVAIRNRAIEAGVALPFRRVRRAHALFSAYRFERSRIEVADRAQTLDRGALRAGWTFDSSKRYGYSISPESGIESGFVLEAVRAALGGHGNATLLKGDLRAFIPLGPRHAVLAVRATAADSRGDENTRRVLRLGGPDANPSVISFDEDASSLLRGFPSNAFLGTAIALGNIEYRVPIAWIERGVGTWPVFLRSAHGSLFVDAGNAWTGRVRAADTKTSSGFEIGADVVAGYVLPLTLTAGLAWGHDPAGRFPDSRQIYGRLGYGF
jgi:dipeptidyl aminopeptidase/acylaminoacyl peptidase